jgi:hypothetical protein
MRNAFRTLLPVVLVAAGLLTATLVGCGGYTSCGIGDQSCSFDRKKAQKCIGPDEGGDADGEIKTLENCGASDKVCAEDADDSTTPMTIEVGCIPAKCDKVWPCYHPGETRCMDEYLMACAERDGCPTWVSVQNCTEDGLNCTTVQGQGACTR